MKAMLFSAALIERALEKGDDLAVGEVRYLLKIIGTPDSGLFDQAFPHEGATLLVEKGMPTEVLITVELPDDGCPEAPCDPAQSKIIMKLLRSGLESKRPITMAELSFLVYQVQGWHLATMDNPAFPDAIIAADFGPTTAAILSEFGDDPEAYVVSQADISAWHGSFARPDGAP